MQRDAEPSYLTVAAYALAIMVGVMLLTTLFGGFEPNAVAAR